LKAKEGCSQYPPSKRWRVSTSARYLSFLPAQSLSERSHALPTQSLSKRARARERERKCSAAHARISLVDRSRSCPWPALSSAAQQANCTVTSRPRRALRGRTDACSATLVVSGIRLTSTSCSKWRLSARPPAYLGGRRCRANSLDVPLDALLRGALQLDVCGASTDDEVKARSVSRKRARSAASPRDPVGVYLAGSCSCLRVLMAVLLFGITITIGSGWA
jgi:hypothetical protein